jgi:RNA polymerase sigma-54 factor
MLKQNLQQKLLQKLSPQQIQFIKLLQVPTVSLDTRIKEELEENPALEDLSLTNLNEPEEQYPDRDPDEETFNGDEERGEAEEFNIDDYLQDDNLNDYGSRYDQNGDVKKCQLLYKARFLRACRPNWICCPYQTKTLG